MATQDLDRKLAQFRWRHYGAQALLGLGLLLVALGVVYLAVVLVEGALWLPTGTRTVLVWSVLGVGGMWLIIKVLYPFGQAMRLIPGMTDEEAARRIGQALPSVQDRLLNLLELKRLEATSPQPLLAAAVSQRTERLSTVPFFQAVDLRRTRRVLLWVLLPLGLAGLLWATLPDFMQQSTTRVLAYNQHFAPPPPFQVEFAELPQYLVAGEAFTLEVNLKGNALPGELFLYRGTPDGGDLQPESMTRETATRFSYTFRAVYSDVAFAVGNPLYATPTQVLPVKSRPVLERVQVLVTPPAYTGLPAKQLPPNVADVTAPVGSRIEWTWTFREPITQATFGIDTAWQQLDNQQSKQLNTSHRLMANAPYTLLATNADGLSLADTLRYSLRAEPDLRPKLEVLSPPDGELVPNTGILPLAYEAADDYGLGTVELHYRIVPANKQQDPNAPFVVDTLANAKGQARLVTNTPVDWYGYGVNDGDRVEWFLRVWDNDRVTGPKAATSPRRTLGVLTVDALYDSSAAQSDSIQRLLDASAKEAADVANDLERLQKELLAERAMGYESKRKIQQMLREQRQLSEKLQTLNQTMQRAQDMLERNQLMTPQNMETMQRLAELVEQLEQRQQENTANELEKNLDELDKSQLAQKLDQLDFETDNLNKDLKRLQQLFKQMRAEQQQEAVNQQLSDALRKQTQLEERTEAAQQKAEQQNAAPDSNQMKQLAREQEALKQAMDSLKKALQELKEMKQEANQRPPKDLDQLQKDAEEAATDMQKAAQDLQQQQPQDAQPKQKQAKQRLQKMQQQMAAMQQKQQGQKHAEDYETLRQLLENLLTLSEDQEDLRKRFGDRDINDPKIHPLLNEQRVLQANAGVLRDSLEALAQRASEVKQVVLDEVRTIDRALDRTFYFLNEKQLVPAQVEQHRAMTSMNTLANMLTESLQNLQQQMMMNSGKGGKPMPMPKAGSGESMRELTQQQKQLNQKLAEMMKAGEVDGDKLAEMAAKQAKIREALKGKFEELQKGGKLGGKLGDPKGMTSPMEETEEELKAKRLEEETLIRQQQILSRMLDFDKALREREYENRRESRTGMDRQRTSPNALPAQRLPQDEGQDPLRQRTFSYQTAYQRLIDAYFDAIAD